MASGVKGKKGVPWWSINTILEMRHPKYVFLENVDRLLKSPTAQRGRDFAIILSCFYRLGYSVEWHVVNAADYGIPQRRRCMYIYAEYDAPKWDLEDILFHTDVEARAFPIEPDERFGAESFSVSGDSYKSTKEFGIGDKISRFKEAGVMQDGKVLTHAVSSPSTTDRAARLERFLVPVEQVPDEFFITGNNLKSWEYLKDGKHENRTVSNHEYVYSEGPIAFPDPLDKPRRTILTGEGGRGASRTKHVVV